eukprot:GFYU01012618.1.p1 GENE.GFYU01012618.1~~GFYU01012618.1.p1  ORF type:complete len:456 (+),score=122.49 GFYU01012618.1:114-1481(+)
MDKIGQNQPMSKRGRASGKYSRKDDPTASEVFQSMHMPEFDSYEGLTSENRRSYAGSEPPSSRLRYNPNSARSQEFTSRTNMEPAPTAVQLMKAKNAERYANLRTAFMTRDKDRSGFLDKHEIKAIARQYGIDDTHFENLFKYVDRDKDGRISYEEFSLALYPHSKEEGGLLPDRAESNKNQWSGGRGFVNENYSGYRTDAPKNNRYGDNGATPQGQNFTGSATRGNFERAAMDARSPTDALKNWNINKYESIRHAFLAHDKDRSGYLDYSEIVAMCKQLNMAEEHVKSILDKVDVNRDGKIDYMEFCTTLNRVAEDRGTLPEREGGQDSRKKLDYHGVAMMNDNFYNRRAPVAQSPRRQPEPSRVPSKSDVFDNPPPRKSYQEKTQAGSSSQDQVLWEQVQRKLTGTFANVLDLWGEKAGATMLADDYTLNKVVRESIQKALEARQPTPTSYRK